MEELLAGHQLLTGVVALAVLVVVCWLVFRYRVKKPHSIQPGGAPQAGLDVGAQEFFSVVGVLLGFIGFAVAGLVGLYVLVWLVKRMWEAA